MDGDYPASPSLDTNRRRRAPFVDPVAVEAWDAWFRWRDERGLRDLSVDATWGRVAETLSAVEPASTAAAMAERYIEAFSSWQLLLDERILASAGTRSAGWRADNLVAVLNAASFVRGRSSARASFDHAGFAGMAELAVRALDSAALLVSPAAPRSLRIGIVGLADALALMRLGYVGADARTAAAAIAQSLAEGCLRGSIRLAAERKTSADGSVPKGRPVPDDVVDDAKRYGIRHEGLTAITSQPRLALFANNVADALDPLRGEAQTYLIPVADHEQAFRSSGYALSVAGAGATSSRFETLEQIPLAAQLDMRAAVAGSIDEPIAYALPLPREPGVSEWRLARDLAERHGLPEPWWRPVRAELSAAN